MVLMRTSLQSDLPQSAKPTTILVAHSASCGYAATAPIRAPEGRHKMSRTFTNLLTHLVFSTKDREPLILPELKSELYAYLGGLTGELKGKAYGINGTKGHIHMLIGLPPAVSISEALRFIKSNSSGWVHEKWPRKPFAWQLGYGAFSVSKSNVPEVLKYIRSQEAHHRKTSFKEEFIEFLVRHEIEYDGRYIWL
jgi:putative transposase